MREICKALKLENEYTKDEILEAYLNVVNFGNNCQGVESAAQLYFDKSIENCSIAECAAIAGITQNPSKWNPLSYPENNKIRREIIINEMYDQGKITEDEYDAAMKESANMTFVGTQAIVTMKTTTTTVTFRTGTLTSFSMTLRKTLHNTTTSVRTLRPISFTQRVLKSTALWI